MAVNNQAALERLNKDLIIAWEKRLSDFDPDRKEVADFVYPNAKRFITGDAKHDRSAMKRVLFNDGKNSLDKLASGMMSGTCSPSRPWFGLGVDKVSVDIDQSFKVALQSLADAVTTELSKSNFYRVMHQIFKQEGAFGTACALIDNFDDKDDDAPALDLILVPFGQYALRADYKNRVDGIYRKLSMTTTDIINKFGDKGYKDAGLPDKVQDAIKNKKTHEQFTVFHVIEKTPPKQLVEDQVLKSKYYSYYFIESEKDKFLAIYNYENMPAITPRWEVLGDDVYGECPASMSIGDLREAQKLKLLTIEGTERAVKPPVLLPNTMQDQVNRLIPGGVLFYEPDNTGTVSVAQVQPAMNVRVDYSGVTLLYNDAINRVKSAFYTDLFVMLDGIETGRMTATEVAERKNEKMLMLGSVLERQTDEALRPIIHAVIERILTKLTDRYPDIAEAMKNFAEQEYDVQFVSILAQAQKASGSANLERGAQFLFGIANASQEFAQAINFDALARHYIDINSLPADVVKSPEEVQRLRDEIARQQQEQAQAQQFAQASQGAGNLVQSAGVLNQLGQNPNVVGG